MYQSIQKSDISVRTNVVETAIARAMLSVSDKHFYNLCHLEAAVIQYNYFKVTYLPIRRLIH